MLKQSLIIAVGCVKQLKSLTIVAFYNPEWVGFLTRNNCGPKFKLDQPCPLVYPSRLRIYPVRTCPDQNLESNAFIVKNDNRRRITNTLHLLVQTRLIGFNHI